MFIDTHTHLYLPEFEADGNEAAVDRAVEAGVGHMIFPNVDLTTVEPMKRLHSVRSEVTSMAMGFHPTEVNADWRDSLSVIKSELYSAPEDYCAVGEIGIDLYWDTTFVSQQMQALEQQLEWAAELDLPIIIHCRSGLPQTLEVLSEFPDIKGVMHSFGGTTADVEKVLDMNEHMMFGINGIVTFKNSNVKDALDAITLSRLLLETDSPYLAPVPKRGKRCESAFLPHTASFIADYCNIPVESLAKITSDNARRLFHLK